MGTSGRASSPAGGSASFGPAWDRVQERLWAAGARAAWTAATQGRGGHGSGWATGSPECCVCPICRSIAAMRDPSPETAERLATGAGDLATGVAGLMRAFSAMSGSRPRPARRPAASPPADPAATWSAATRADAHRQPGQTPGTAGAHRGAGPVPGDTDVHRGAGPVPGDTDLHQGAGPVPGDTDLHRRAGSASGDGGVRRPVGPVPGAESPWAAATRAAAREQAEEARRRAVAVNRERAEAARRRAEEARLRVEEARAAAEAARRSAAERAESAEPAPGNAWTAGPRPGQDVWAAATAEREDGGGSGAPGVDHDGTGDDA